MKNKKKLILIISIVVLLIIGIIISIILLKPKDTNTNDSQFQEINSDVNNNNEDNNALNENNENNIVEENKDEEEKKEEKNNESKEGSSTSNKEQKSNNTNSKSNTNNNTDTNRTQNNSQNNSSNQLIPVGTTYTGNGTKVTILDGNKAKLEYNGGTWTTDIVDKTGAGVQYNISFKHKAGSGSPKYYYQGSILFPMSTSVMSNNINGAGGVHISGVSSNLGSLVNSMYVGKANGYSCTPNLNTLNSGGSDGCSSWASSVKGDVHSQDYDYVTYYVFNGKMEVLGYVFLEARLKPESEWVGTGDQHVNPANWNIKQLYK